MSKIKILVIPSDTHGVGKFRMLDPYKFIGDNYIDDVHVDITFDAENRDEYFLNYNVVVNCCPSIEINVIRLPCNHAWTNFL